MSDAKMHIHFVERDPGAVAALWAAFEGVPSVTVARGDICKPPVTGQDVVLATAANSYGAMNGGVDGFINTYLSSPYGYISESVKEVIAQQFFGEQPVGTCILVPTRTREIGWLAHAPTMRVPQPVADTLNAYLAFRAVLISCRLQGGIRHLVCPMFCSGAGEMPHAVAARQMRTAFDRITGFRATARDWQDIHRSERALCETTT